MISEVARQYNAHNIEDQIRDYWQISWTYKKVRSLRKGGKKFFFVDGPPYTTGRIHLGTAWNKIIKDTILRYKSMNGFEVKDRAGWDMHGLPIEVKVEESFGFRNKRDIESYGVDRFIDRCKEFAMNQLADMTIQFKALGTWLDWEDPYMTLKNEYIEAAWWTLEKANQHNLLERGLRVVNWCPRCQTALADAEVEYWDETNYSIYVKFPIQDQENAYIVIWTTTPWTIPANVAIAIHPKFEYSKVRAYRDGKVEVLIMASELVESVLKEGRYKDFELLERLTPDEMRNLRYESPLVDFVPHQKQIIHGIYTANFVTAEKTGCVHIAPGHGIEDFELGLENDLEVFCPVGEDGCYTEEVGPKYNGKFVREADDDIVSDLANNGLLLAQGKLVHRYGHCWRCKTPIIFLATRQWFLKVSELRQMMLNEIGKIAWYPDWAGSARFADWISNARDWCISRQRYWGIPLPIWICQICGYTEVIGTALGLEERSGKKLSDLHRPEVDAVLLECPCGGKMERSRDVFDVWFDSAVASWGTLHFPREHDDFDLWWPADFITEGHDQTRGWFYSQLGASMVSFGRAPYKSVLMHGFALDEHGRKMSKSIGNVVQPEEVLNKYGTDALRFYVLSANAPWDDLHFSWDAVENVSRMLNIFWNAYRFALPYMIIDRFDPSIVDISSSKIALRAEDRWIISRANSLIQEVTKDFEKYELHRVTRSIMDFILEDLSRWYIQLVRPRTWIEQDDPDKLAAYCTIYEVMKILCKLMAPFIPFLSESIYQNLVRGANSKALESVHMCDWPTPKKELIDKNLEQAMSLVREIAEAASNARQKAGRKLRWPVSEIVISPDNEMVDLQGLDSVLKVQTNSKKITILPPGQRPRMDLELLAVPKKIGPVFKNDAMNVMHAIKSADPFRVKSQLESGDAVVNWEGIDYSISKEMVEIKETPPTNLSVAPFTCGNLYVDVALSPELEREGYVREVIRRIQDMRKELDLRVEDKIKVSIRSDDEQIMGIIERKKDYIAGEVRAIDMLLTKQEDVKGEMIKEWIIEDSKLKIGLNKIQIDGA